MSQEPKKKPSWTEKMPERDDTPGMQMKIEKDESFGLDRDSLGFDRDSLSSPDEDDVSTDELTDNAEIQKALEEERKKNAAQLERIKALEAQQLAAQKLADQKLADQKLADQKLADQKLADQKLADQKLADQKLQTQQIKEKDLQVKKTDEPKAAKPILNTNYRWKKIKNAAPEYPSKAARTKKSGWVDVEIVIDTNGEVVESRIARTENDTHIFDKSALKAVKKWKYEPPANYGITSNQTKTVRLVYKL